MGPWPVEVRVLSSASRLRLTQGSEITVIRAVSKTVNPGSNPGSPADPVRQTPVANLPPDGQGLYDAGGANVKGVDGAAHARDGDRRRLPGALRSGPGSPRPPPRCPHALAHPHQVPLPKIRKAITCLINKERSKRDRPELKPNRRLQLAAQRHNDTMLAEDCFRHRCKGEPGISGRVRKTGYTEGQSGRTGSPRTWATRTPRAR